jgi:assimilatory nitrate reductase catalytic subunit
VGCGVVVSHEAGRITGVRGDKEHPANRGRLCSKGQSLNLTVTPEVTAQVRALHPMRRATRGGPLARVGWDAAFDEAATRIAALVHEHGPDSVGFYLSGQLLTEDYHAFNKLAKGLVFTNHVDTNSRLCMSSAVAGYKASFGADSVPSCYDDIDHAATIFITDGSRPPAPATPRCASSSLTRAVPRPPPRPRCTCRCCRAPTSCCTMRCCM